MDFLSIFNDTNSTKNKKTGEIIINIPNIEYPDESFIISTPCKISSNCNTIITCKSFIIKSTDVSLSNFTLDSSLEFTNKNNISISHFIFKSDKEIKYCIEISECKNILFDDIEITGSYKTGFFIADSSEVTINNSKIHDLKETLIGLRRQSTLKMNNTKVYKTEAHGLNSDVDCTLEISNCFFSDIKFSALYLTKTKLSLKNSQIKNCDQTSVACNDIDEFIVEGNEFYYSEYTGFYAENCKGVVKGNKFTKFKGNGAFAAGKSNIEIINNEFIDNEYPAVVVKDKASAKIIGNKIIKNETNGISIRATSDVLIQYNEINDIEQCGISISDSDKITVINNIISNCNVIAIESYNKSNVCVYSNKISNIKKYAFLAYTSGYINAVKNTIDNIEIAMAKLAFKGSGEFFENEIISCVKQCECQTSSNYLFYKNGNFQGVTNDKQRSNDSILFEEKFVDTKSSEMCLKCNQKPHNCFLLDCGHNVYCKECAEVALNNKENCPLCRWEIVNVSPGFNSSNDENCIICLSNEPNCIVLPCGHMGVCEECLDNWFRTKKVCPVCRTDNSFYKKILNSKI